MSPVCFYCLSGTDVMAALRNSAWTGHVAAQISQYAACGGQLAGQVSGLCGSPAGGESEPDAPAVGGGVRGRVKLAHYAPPAVLRCVRWHACGAWPRLAVAFIGRGAPATRGARALSLAARRKAAGATRAGPTAEPAGEGVRCLALLEAVRLAAATGAPAAAALGRLARALAADRHTAVLCRHHGALAAVAGAWRACPDWEAAAPAAACALLPFAAVHGCAIRRLGVEELCARSLDASGGVSAELSAVVELWCALGGPAAAQALPLLEAARRGAAPPAVVRPLLRNLARRGGGRTRIAYFYPYLLGDLLADLRRLRPSEGDWIEMSTVGSTSGGRPILMLRVTDFPTISQQVDGHARRHIIVSARVHPGESPASFMMRGVLQLLLSAEPEAQMAWHWVTAVRMPRAMTSTVAGSSRRLDQRSRQPSGQWPAAAPIPEACSRSSTCTHTPAATASSRSATQAAR
ncbi:unnamed protein product, partial [Prorocentrum cordatum]